MSESEKLRCPGCNEKRNMNIYPLTRFNEHGHIEIVVNSFWAQCNYCDHTKPIKKVEGGWAPLLELDTSYYIPSFCKKHQISFFGVGNCPFCKERR